MIKSFNRRALLRGTGSTLISLPLGAFATYGDKLIGAPGEEAPVRLFTMPWPNGSPPDLLDFNEFFKPLAGLQSQIALIKGMSHPVFNASGGAPHVAGAITAFSGTPASADGLLPTSASMDQVMVESMKPTTKLKSVHTGFTTFGHLRSGVQTLDYRSFDSKGNLMTPLVDPYRLFVQLFGKPNGQTDQGIILAKRRASILDAVVEQLKVVNSEGYGLAKESRAQLSDHLDHMRELERRAEAAALCTPPTNAPSEAEGQSLANSQPRMLESLSLIADMLVLAFQCDIVRYGCLSVGESAYHFNDTKILGMLGAGIDGHEAAHFEGTRGTWITSGKFMMLCINTMMQKFSVAKDIDGRSLLDNSIFYSASEISNHSQSGHYVSNMPALVIGGGVHGVPVGKTLDARQKPIPDALASCMNAAGLKTMEKFGPYGTGKLF
ncbi:MAG: DUF1552 domain-containing protein [Proteobacteria bacterium]|nr:MAG: DUF1552 domain-containing protein [Pseudomonadota bacterium]